MIWYEIPLLVSRTMFAALLVIAIMQIIIALYAGDVIQDKRILRLIRWQYSLLAVISVSLSGELLLAVASVEGGVYLSVPAAFRYVSFLPVFLLLYLVKAPVERPQSQRLFIANCCIPLLLLLPEVLLPAQISVFLIAFVTVWFALDSVRMLLSFMANAGQTITHAAITQVIQSLRHGVCIANRRGRILEANPAFYKLCGQLGITCFERVNEIDAALKALHETGRIEIAELTDGLSIRTGDSVFLLRQNSFLSGGKRYVELALSDVTQVARTATELERENNLLERENRRLERALSDIETAAATLEREKLSRAAHDLWSQRLAVAGLSIDILLDQKDPERNTEILRGILESPNAADFPPSDLSGVLETLTEMYSNLGVKVHSQGEACFTPREREALCGVLKEALANAVRHAYARKVDLLFYESGGERGVIIQNGCLDDGSNVTEGRGLYDMKARVSSAGGSVTYNKSSVFELRVTFSKKPPHPEKAVQL